MKVKSSLIESVGYDPDTKKLTVDFLSGDQWTYEGVTPEDWAGLVSARSIGRYFLQNVKGKFPGTKTGGTQSGPRT